MVYGVLLTCIQLCSCFSSNPETPTKPYSNTLKPGTIRFISPKTPETPNRKGDLGCEGAAPCQWAFRSH